MASAENRLIIFAHARSGSTSLVRSLNLHPALRLSEEPFHPKYGNWHPEERSYLDYITDLASLNVVLEDIFSKYDGIKILDYQLSEELYCNLLLRDAYKVIYLRRRNVLKTIISNLIADQTTVWHISDLDPARSQLYGKLKPLSFDEIEKRFAYHKELQELYRSTVSSKPTQLRMFVDYEDLYTDDLIKNREKLRDIFQFIGLNMPKNPQIDLYLDPRSARILSAETYNLIPNVAEVEARFGCDATGWLFERT